MVLNVHDEEDVGLNVLGCRADILGTIKSTETIRLIGDGEKRGIRRWQKEGDYRLSLHRHHQNDSYIKMGSDENHFNVSSIVRDKVTRQCLQSTTFLKRRESQSRESS